MFSLQHCMHILVDLSHCSLKWWINLLNLRCYFVLAVGLHTVIQIRHSCFYFNHTCMFLLAFHIASWSDALFKNKWRCYFSLAVELHIITQFEIHVLTSITLVYFFVGLSHCMVILLQNSQLASSILRGPSCMRRWQQNLTRRDLHFLGMARLRSPWRYTSSHLYMIRMCALRKNSLDTIICEQAMTYVWVAHLLRICGENLNAFVLCSCQISLKWRKGK